MTELVTMHAKDALRGSAGKAFIILDGQRYFFAQLKNIKATDTKNKTKIGILGKTGKGNKSNGVEGTATATFYFNTSIFRKIMLKYRQTGEDIYFDTQITNEDATSSVGRQTTILKDCNLDSTIMAYLDVDADVLEEDISFTYEDVDMPEEFNILAEMQA